MSLTVAYSSRPDNRKQGKRTFQANDKTLISLASSEKMRHSYHSNTSEFSFFFAFLSSPLFSWLNVPPDFSMLSIVGWLNQEHLGNVSKSKRKLIFTFSTESVNVSHRLFHFQMTDVVRNQRICYTARKREKFVREF